MNTKAIAILTGGASLARDWSDEMYIQYEIVFAVNRAALSYQHDWNCFCDEQMRAAAMASESKTWMGHYTTQQFASIMPVRIFELYGGHPSLLEQRGIESFERSPCEYTFPCALLEVAKLSEKTGYAVDIFGLDCGGVGIGDSREYGWIRWRLELPWVAYAMPELIQNIHGDIREDWKKWIQKPEGRLPL